MRLFFTALHDESELRSFSFKPDHLEEGLDFLNFVIAQGDTLLNAHLVDEFSAIELPLDAFDGSPFSVPLKKLEQEWTDLLCKKGCVPTDLDQELITWTMKRIHHCEERIADQRLMIERIEALRQRAQEKMVFEPGRTNLINHYESQLTLYHQQVTKSQKNHRQLGMRLNKLIE